MRISFKSFLLPAILGLGTALSAGAQTLLTIAGSGPSPLPNWYSGDGGPATLAQFSTPDDLAFDAAGNLFIADANNCVVRKVAAGTQLISTYAGSMTVSGGVTLGLTGYSGDGGPATLATLDYPAGLAVDAGGNLYIGDFYNNVVREVFAASGAITTVVGSGSPGYSGDGGPALLADLNCPYGLTFDSSGNLYIADSANNVVRKVTVGTGFISTVAGTGVTGFTGDGGPATLAAFNAPQRLAFDPTGNLYIADPGNFAVRKMAAGTGLLTTVAGNGTSGFSGDGGPATLSINSGPDGIAVGCNGNLFLTDDFNTRIRMVSSATGTITTVAGNGTVGYTASGPALTSPLSHPEALAFFQGNLYDVDYGNGVVQQVDGLCPPSPTPTATSTPSLTPTKTPTPTSTSTPTLTPTPTPSSTPSPTATSTPSPTPTETPSPTNSPTPSATPTSTGTPTPSSTPSSTPTPTASFTPSSTPTPSPTPTWGISLAKQVVPGTAQGGTTLTYTLAVTVTGGAFTGVAVTDTLPANG